jgi:hypothetical protein
MMWKLLLVCLLLLPACCKAEGNCRWLNEATAAGVLNGPVSMEVKDMGDMGGTCTFGLRSEPKALGLQIVVRKIGEMEKGITGYGSHCVDSSISLQAIGNEATACAVNIGGSRGEQVVGRVRDRVFIISIDAAMSPNPSENSKLLQQKAESVAEQVAGSLF